jgi:hypothetical protein
VLTLGVTLVEALADATLHPLDPARAEGPKSVANRPRKSRHDLQLGGCRRALFLNKTQEFCSP